MQHWEYSDYIQILLLTGLLSGIIGMFLGFMLRGLRNRSADELADDWLGKDD